MSLMEIENYFAWDLVLLLKKELVHGNECLGHVDEHKRG